MKRPCVRQTASKVDFNRKWGVRFVRNKHNRTGIYLHRCLQLQGCLGWDEMQLCCQSPLVWCLLVSRGSLVLLALLRSLLQSPPVNTPTHTHCNQLTVEPLAQVKRVKVAFTTQLSGIWVDLKYILKYIPTNDGTETLDIVQQQQ